MTLLSLDLGEPKGTNESSAPASRLPRVWVGYLFALGFLVVIVVEGVIDPSTLDQEVTLPSFLAALAGFAYWLYCVYRLHVVLKEATHGTHPIPPGRSVIGHILPLYNIVFVFRWPNALAGFINSKLPERRMWKGWVGAILLGGFFVSRFFDSAIGEVILFSVLVYLNRRVAAVLSAQVNQHPVSGLTTA